ncbi:polysaccharide lyase family 1 protein [Nocardia sp. NPDC059177]|uniref:pectate lyase family protein n=1 Tax=Nocardia sp. NPDC059177 TaxID=3346759 RepID=UPI00369CB53E
MRVGSTLFLALALVVAGAGPAVAQCTEPPGDAVQKAREHLAADDGWAAADGGTTGGADAAQDQIFTVRTRQELKDAVAGDTPKIVVVDGHIEFLADCASYQDPGYTEQKYLDTYRDTTTISRGSVEDARQRSANNQERDMVIEVGSNTTLIGLPGAKITGLELGLTRESNIIIRDLEIQDAYGCFPRWSGYDWKTYNSTIRMEGARHVWLDHLTLGDGTRTLATETTQYGKTYLHHDELITVMKGSDLITISWSRLHDNFKPVMLGVLDDGASNTGNTRVTMHHNLFDKTVLRSPTVYYGQVHLYNNSHVAPPSTCCWYYQWGVGTDSAIYAENNVFTGGMPEVRDILWNFGGTAVHETGTLVAGEPVDLVAQFNASTDPRDPDLGTDVGWQPTLHGPIDPAEQVSAIVEAGAGAGRTG